MSCLNGCQELNIRQLYVGSGHILRYCGFWAVGQLGLVASFDGCVDFWAEYSVCMGWG